MLLIPYKIHTCLFNFKGAFDECKDYILEQFSQHLKTLLEMNPEERNTGHISEEGEAFVDLQRAYGFLLSACKLKEAPPPKEVSTKDK